MTRAERILTTLGIEAKNPHFVLAAFATTMAVGTGWVVYATWYSDIGMLKTIAASAVLALLLGASAGAIDESG